MQITMCPFGFTVFQLIQIILFSKSQTFYFFDRQQEEKNTMYEQSLDAEYFNPEFGMYHGESRFYDDYTNNHQVTSSYLKNNSAPYHHHTGIPTPPSTPDKPPMSYGNFNSHHSQQQQHHQQQPPPPTYMVSQQNSYVHQTPQTHHHTPFSPSGKNCSVYELLN